MNYRLILGSASPRRQELLKGAGFDFEIRLSDVAEVYPPETPLEKIPEYLAELKADSQENILQEDELLITADTVVILEDKVIGKPAGREDAIQMLGQLSGKKHVVITGVHLRTHNKRLSFSVFTDVYFSTLNMENILYYVDHFQPFDKAGAYGIQEWIGYVGIERINGSFYNVMGLPVCMLYRKLKEFGM